MSDPRLHLLVERLSNVLREDLREVASRHELALAQLEALHFLAVANRHSDTLSSLVAYLGATKGTVSQTLSALVRKGLVERVADPDDGRVQHCRLTPAGSAIVAESLPAPALRGVVADQAAAEGLERVLRALLASRGGVAFGVCRTCAHHEARPGGGRCRLLDVALTPLEVDQICREHRPAA